MGDFRAENGVFAVTAAKWGKGAGRHQHLPLSMARIACSSFHRVKWVGADKAYGHAIGQEFAKALLAVLCPEEYVEAYQSELEEEFDETLVRGPCRCGQSEKKKNELTFGMYSKLNKDGDF